MEKNMQKVRFVSGYREQTDYEIWGIVPGKNIRVSVHNEDDSHYVSAGGPVISCISEGINDDNAKLIVEYMNEYADYMHTKYLSWAIEWDEVADIPKTVYPSKVMYLDSGWHFIDFGEEE